MWNSLWLPSLGNGKVTTVRQDEFPTLMVADLLQPDVKAWDVEM